MTACFRCGAEVATESRYCGRCGQQIADPQAGTMIVEPESGDALLHRLRHVVTGEYEIEEEIGSGGMAVVFRATEVGLRRPVALKVLRPDLSFSARAAERFRREAQMVASLEHANIIPVYRVGQLGGLFHIAMKFIAGRSLEAIIQEQGALPASVILAVLRGAARGLAYAHERDIVHRDVKSANIMIDVEGRVMVSDFGVAVRASDVTLTVDGTVIGTPAYMSPEQCSGLRAGPSSDQYSLGVVAFQMMAGVVPFESDTLAGMMQHHFFTLPPDIRPARLDLPEALVACVLRALEKDAAGRFPSMSDMLAALDAIPLTDADLEESDRLLRDLARGNAAPRIATGSLGRLTDARTVTLPAPPRRARCWPAVAAAAGMVLVATGAWLATNRTPPPPVREAQLGGIGAAPDSTTSPPAAGLPAARAVPPAAPTGAARIRMLTSPPSAEIVIDDRRVGVGSLLDWRVPVGTRRIRVQAPGYESWDTTVVLAAGELRSFGKVVLRARELEE